MTIPTMRPPKAAAERFEKKDSSCFVTSKIPTDLTVQINDITFYIHKFPLLSKSGYMSRLDLQDSNYDYDIKMDNFPGGPETFELIVKFCYGLPIDLTPTNVAPLRCAAEFLEMTEDVDNGNLVSKTESFITFTALTSWRDTIIVLQSCGPLSPWAENLQIVRRCCDSIARKATSSSGTNSANEEAAGHDSEGLWWFNDVCTLGINHFVRTITMFRAKGLRPEIIGACIEHYAIKWLPGFDGQTEPQRCSERGEIQLSILSGSVGSGGEVQQNKEQRRMIESLVSALPPQREAVSCKFLLWMLKMATVYSAAQALVSEMEKRVGMVLEDATVDDLLIPNYPSGDSSGLGEEGTMHNVDMVHRIVEYFLMHEEQPKCARKIVGRLLDNYLAEIAKDEHLSAAKFLAVAEALPANSRTCDDGLYRAIDTYLKAHPTLNEHERRRLCRVMDCNKLSLDACLHAAQNDRLPLRTVVQVLFTEQVKMRAAMEIRRDPALSDNMSEQGSSSWSTTKQEVIALKAEVERMKIKVTELHQDCSELLHLEHGKATKHQRQSTTMWKKFRDSAFFFRKLGGEQVGEAQPKQGRRRLRRISIS